MILDSFIHYRKLYYPFVSIARQTLWVLGELLVLLLIAFMCFLMMFL